MTQPDNQKLQLLVICILALINIGHWFADTPYAARWDDVAGNTQIYSGVRTCTRNAGYANGSALLIWVHDHPDKLFYLTHPSVVASKGIRFVLSKIREKDKCKHPGKPDHSLLEIFRHTDYVPGGDRHAQSTIHRTPDHRRSQVRRSRTHR